MVDSGFTRKKVASLTLGEKMKKLRGDLRLSLPEVSKATKIQVKYLEYLEQGDYQKLPADVYVRGFLRSYARYLNIDEQAFIRQYDRERNIQENLGHEQPKDKKATDFSTSSLVITPRTLVMFLIVLSVGGAFFYLYREFRSFAAEPRLMILEPRDKSVFEASEVVIRGKTDKGARVSINNQPVFVAGEGEFSDKLILQPGLNTVTVVAVNRFDKERSETISLEAKYAMPQALPEPAQPEAQDPETFKLILSVRTGSATVLVTSEGKEILNEKIAKGETREVEGKGELTISSDRPELTLVQIGEKEPEALASRPGKAETVVYTKDGKQSSASQDTEKTP